MMDLATFRAQYPEFEKCPDPLATAFLNDAAGQIDSTVWGIHTDRGHGLLTAHLLSMAPNGQFARLESDKAQSTYGVQYEKLRNTVACAIRTF